jgi:hypothetical protein
MINVNIILTPNLEMCGGAVRAVPCSKVIFLKFDLHKDCWGHFETFAQHFYLTDIYLTFTG